MTKQWPYFLPSEVSLHNTATDLWVSFLYQVFDLTSLVQSLKGSRTVEPLLAYAGKDISHWFDERTGDLKHRVHPVTGALVPYLPNGPLPHVHPVVPTMRWEPIKDDMPWWMDKEKKYMVGYLTRRARPLRVINVLAPHTHRDVHLWVCSEERLDAILQRILPHNTHARSYTMKFEGRVLHMNKTLEENLILDERDKWLELGMTDDNYIPAVKLYYNDDLTV